MVCVRMRRAKPTCAVAPLEWGGKVVSASLSVVATLVAAAILAAASLYTRVASLDAQVKDMQHQLDQQTETLRAIQSTLDSRH